MTEKNTRTDLCINCLNVGGCLYEKTKKAPVHFCEEFTCDASQGSVTDAKRRKREKALSLPKTAPGLFDDCGKPGCKAVPVS